MRVCVRIMACVLQKSARKVATRRELSPSACLNMTR